MKENYDLLKFDDQNISTSIDNFAKKFMQNYIININSITYGFTEIEFYYYSETHLDSYCHIKEFDKIKKYENGNFRFHYSGVDIVFFEKNTYICGILIRGIKKISKDPQYISGPLKVVNEILNQLHNPFKQMNNIFIIEKKENIKSSKISNIVRFGLNEKYLDFKNKKYRYLLIDEIFKNNQPYYNTHIKKYID